MVLLPFYTPPVYARLMFTKADHALTQLMHAWDRVSALGKLKSRTTSIHITTLLGLMMIDIRRILYSFQCSIVLH